MREFDLVIIGGGAAGFAAATRANDLSFRAAIINDGLPVGGTCVNVGCVPSKHLLHLAELAYRPSTPAGSAIGAVRPAVDFREAIRGTAALVATLRGANYEHVLHAIGATYVPARARFVSPTEVEAGGERYTARAFLVATGTRPSAPPIPGLAEAGYWTNREALQAERLPEHLVVIGAGPIGLEIGQAFHRLGSRVTVLEALDQILPRFEPLVAAELARALTDEGMAIHTSARVEGIRLEGAHKVVSAVIDGQPRDFSCEEILVATGVRPNTEELGLAAAGVRVDARGFVETDAQLRTSAERIYAAGDVTGHGFLETLAAKEGALAAEKRARRLLAHH